MWRLRGIGFAGRIVSLCPVPGHAVETALGEVRKLLEGGRAEVEVRRRAGDAAVRDCHRNTFTFVCERGT